MTGPTAEYTITRQFDAPPERLFEAWTEPADFSAWFAPDGWRTPADRVSLDLRPGGAWSAVLVGPDGSEAPLGGTYREIDPPGRLVFTTGDPDNPGDGPASVTTVELAGTNDGGTEMAFHQFGVNTDQDHADAAAAGWQQFFDKLADVVTE